MPRRGPKDLLHSPLASANLTQVILVVKKRLLRTPRWGARAAQQALSLDLATLLTSANGLLSAAGKESLDQNDVGIAIADRSE